MLLNFNLKPSILVCIFVFSGCVTVPSYKDSDYKSSAYKQEERKEVEKTSFTSKVNILGHGKIKLGDSLQHVKKIVGKKMKSYSSLLRSDLMLVKEKDCSVWVEKSKKNGEGLTKFYYFSNDKLLNLSIIMKPNYRGFEGSFLDSLAKVKQKYGEPYFGKSSSKEINSASKIYFSWQDVDGRTFLLQTNEGFSYSLTYLTNINSVGKCVPKTQRKNNGLVDGI